MTRNMLLLGVSLVLIGCAGERSAAGRADDAAFTAEVFAPGVVSSDGGESWISYHPGGEMIVFGRHNPENWGDHTIFVSRADQEGWTEPEVAPFSGSYNDRGARFTPDGQSIYFSSNRPRPGDTEPRDDHDIWMVDWTPDGWSSPRLLPAPVISAAPDAHPSVAADGTIYFASGRAGGAGRWDLYRARPTDGGYEVESLGPDINTPRSETDIYVDPEQRFIIFVRTDDPDGFGGDDLFYSEPTESGWTPPRNLGAAVNTAEYEYGPFLSGDGTTLYFTSHRGGPSDIYEADASSLGIGPASESTP